MLDAITDKKEQGFALKFAAYVARDEAREYGRDAALRHEMPFDEVATLQENQSFLFENMHEKVKHIQVIGKRDPKVASIQGADLVAANAVPGKPTCLFSDSAAPAEE